MRSLAVLRRHAHQWRSNVWRSPEKSDGLALNSGHALTQASPSAPWFPPSGLPKVEKTIERRAVQSFLPSTPYFRSLRMAYSSAPNFTSLVFGRTIDNGVLSLRRYSSINERDDSALEEEVERKAGWLLKAIFIVTALGVASQFFPYMGDNLLQQSISLLHVKDPLFKRMGASRLRRFAIDDTVAEILQQANAAAIVASAPDSSEFDEIGNCKSILLKRFREFEDNQSPSEVAFS